MKRGALLEHHMTSDSFLSAVHQGCYICTKNWSKLNLAAERLADNVARPFTKGQISPDFTEPNETLFLLVFNRTELSDRPILQFAMPIDIDECTLSSLLSRFP
jgi:hypothetical protein